MNEMALAFPPELLKRQAVIYVRQSTRSQVMTNLESQRRQYNLVEMTRGFGFDGIDVIDDDLGVSASGCQACPGSCRECCGNSLAARSGHVKGRCFRLR
ncbi:recombinase family protein, partial [Phaeobacter gallaeciensis]